MMVVHGPASKRNCIGAHRSLHMLEVSVNFSAGACASTGDTLSRCNPLPAGNSSDIQVSFSPAQFAVARGWLSGPLFPIATLRFAVPGFPVAWSFVFEPSPAIELDPAV